MPFSAFGFEPVHHKRRIPRINRAVFRPAQNVFFASAAGRNGKNFKARTIGKCPVVDFVKLNSADNGHELFAGGKRPPADIFHALRKNDFRKRRTTFKCLMTDFLQSLRKCHHRKLCAAGEKSVGNFCCFRGKLRLFK